MPFNAAQIKAIKHGCGPMMVLAGPGSGKTTVITHRIKYLIEWGKVEPGSILVITFTKAAAMQMKDRFEQLIKMENGRVNFGTFHSVFFRILKFAYHFDAGNIIREEQKAQFIREMLGEYKIEVEDEAEFVASILSEISLVKGEMINVNHYYAKNCSEQIFKNLYHGYEDRMRRGNLIDFDDMLVMCYELLTQRGDILAAWQKKYQYILIDEFQDINQVQYEIIRLLAAPENNLFIVGDDDQSIYRFRGAKPEIMLGFEKDYPDCKQILLGINYRCTRTIVEAAGRVIACNHTRFKKEISAQKGEGKPVIVRCFEESQSEVLAIVKEIKAYIQMGYQYQEIAVLYRTNLDPRLLVERLMEYNLPFCMKDSIPNLYDHWICKNVLSYIKIASGNQERSEILQIINRPKRYISRDCMEDQTVCWDALKSFYQDKAWMVEKIEQLEYDLSMIGKMAPAAAVNYIRKAVGYDGYLKEYAQFRRMKTEDLTEVLNQLQESAAGYKTMDAWFVHMEAYAKQLKEQARNRESAVDGISLMTMHSAKGLEYKIVYLLDANEGIMPHHKAVLDVDMEEERRMFYVAMTRAKERLHVYYIKERYNKKQEVSRFVNEFLENPERGRGR